MRVPSKPGSKVIRLAKNLSIEAVVRAAPKGSFWLYEPKTGRLTIVPPLESEDGGAP